MRAGKQLSEFQNTAQGNRSVIMTSASELFDSTVSGSARVDFVIPDEAQVLGCHLRVRIEPWRSYSKDIASGGGSTTPSGGGSTSGGGGSSTPTSSSEASHRHQVFNGNGAPLGLANRSVSAWNEAAGAAVVLDVATNASAIHTWNAAGGHDHTVSIGSHTHSTPNHTHSTPNHTHAQNHGIHLESAYPGAVSVALDGVTVDSLVGGPWAASASSNVFDADLGDVLSSAGWHDLELSCASGKGRARIYVVADVLLL